MLCVLVLCSLAIAPAFAETNALPTEITVDGVTYADVTWGTVTPASVSIRHKTGIASIPLEELSPELQQRFGYDPKKAADYRAAQAARLAESAKREKLVKAQQAKAEKAKKEANNPPAGADA